MGKHTITIDDTLYNNISEYCKLNGLKINTYCNSLLKNGHNMAKFGDIPFGVFNNAHNTEEVENIITENKPIVVEETTQIETATNEVNISSETEVAIQDREKQNIKPKKRRL